MALRHMGAVLWGLSSAEQLSVVVVRIALNGMKPVTTGAKSIWKLVKSGTITKK